MALQMGAIAAAARDISDVLHAEYYERKGWDAGAAEERLDEAARYRVLAEQEAARYGPEHT